jgi:hypothetical protein
MTRWMQSMGVAVALSVLSMTAACGDDDDDGGETESDRIGIARACANNDDCANEANLPLICLTNFKGGYCGLKDCTNDRPDCPEGSRCVTHDDGVNYCFRECVDKYPDCNWNRPTDAENNCIGGGNVTYVESNYQGKVCLPPS